MYVLENADGSISINHTEQLAGYVEVASLPTEKRNWRNAWVLRGGVIEVDLERAKQVQKQLALDIALLRVGKDVRGNPVQKHLDAIDAEIEAINWDAPQTLTALYNTWPASINSRTKFRNYK